MKKRSLKYLRPLRRGDAELLLAHDSCRHAYRIALIRTSASSKRLAQAQTKWDRKFWGRVLGKAMRDRDLNFNELKRLYEMSLSCPERKVENDLEYYDRHMQSIRETGAAFKRIPRRRSKFQEVYGPFEGS